MIPTPQQTALMELEAMLSPARLAAMDPKDRLLAIAQTGLMGDNAGIAQGPLPAPLAAAMTARAHHRAGTQAPAQLPARQLVSNTNVWRRGGGSGGRRAGRR